MNKLLRNLEHKNKEMELVYVDNWKIQAEILTKPVKIGYLVKISNGAERFYVEVMDIKQDKFVGKVCNILTLKKQYDYDDLVAFNRVNIIEILSSSERKIKLANASKDVDLQNKMIFYVEKFEKEHNRTPCNKEINEYFEKHLNTVIFPSF